MLSTRRICESIEEGAAAEDAIESCVESMKSTLGCEAGFIALGTDGETAVRHDTPHMPHARYESDMSSPAVALTADPPPV
jgi:isoaspartyl peptidase/L-asparaginase-like protein (Ntn-hydrolase superfamily)